MTDGIFISRPDLWAKLLEQKRHNIDTLTFEDVSFHVNMGINQAIGIMNSMPAFTDLDSGFIMESKNERQGHSMKLKELRKERNLTQMQLAELSGIYIRQIQRIESGESDIGNITLKTAHAIAKALGVSMEELLGE